jgi:hypothetical protein
MSTQVAQHFGTVDRQSDRAAWRQIADHIEQLIRVQQIDFGEKLPSESMLAEHYGVARTTVRLALSDLRGIGLIRSEQGRGVFANLSNEPSKEVAFPGVFNNVKPSDGSAWIHGPFLLRMIEPGWGELYRIIQNDWRALNEAPVLLGEIQDNPDPSDFWPHYSWKPVGSSEWLGHRLDIRNWQEAADSLVIETRALVEDATPGF